MIFYIFRHGDTVLSKNPLAKFFHQNDTHNLSILPEGIKALENIGNFLKDKKTDVNFTSPYLRCLESSGVVGKAANKKFQINKNLAELEGAENFGNFKKRIINFINKVSQEKYKAVAICTHGAVMSALKHLLLENQFHFFQIWDYPKPGILIIITNNKMQSLDFRKKQSSFQWFTSTN